MKRYAFRILCPYAASTQSRRQAPSTTASVRGTHLMADECCFANSAPPEGPLAVWHNCTARPGIEIRLRIPRSSRGLCLCSRNMRRQVCGLRRRFRRALGTGTRMAESKTVFLSSRTVIDSDGRADRTARSKICQDETWSSGSRYPNKAPF